MSLRLKCISAVFLCAVLRLHANPAEQVFNAINRIRDEADLSILHHDAQAALSADTHAEELFRRGLLSHRSLDGRRVLERYRDAGGTALQAGENLGAGDSVADIVQGWLDSPTHRSNLLNPKWCAAALAYRILENKRLLLVMVFTNARWSNIHFLPIESSRNIRLNASYSSNEPESSSSFLLVLGSQFYTASEVHARSSQVFELEFIIPWPSVWDNGGIASLVFFTQNHGKWENTGLVFLPSPSR